MRFRVLAVWLGGGEALWRRDCDPACFRDDDECAGSSDVGEYVLPEHEEEGEPPLRIEIGEHDRATGEIAAFGDEEDILVERAV